MYVMLLEGSYPQDIRVKKEAESMAAAGLDVMVVTPWQKGLAREETINKVQVKRIGINYSFNVKGILDIINSIFFINWIYLFGMLRLRKSVSIKTLHFHDLPLIKTALILGKKIKCPVIFDMHENYPEMIEEYTLSNKSFFKKIKDRLFFNSKRWKRYEKKYISKPDHIIAVVDEMKDKISADYHIDPSKISVVSNFEKLTFSVTDKKEDFPFDPAAFKLAYIGGISPFRGLESVIKALAICRQKGLRVHFLILGSGNSTYVSSLTELTHRLGLEEEVLFLGQKPFDVLNYYMKSVNLNIIPHLKNNHTDYTIPHKIFQFFLAQTPVIVSDCLPLKRYIDTTDGGFVYEANNEHDLADKIRYIMTLDQDVLDQKAANAYQYTRENLSWETESEKLIHLYKKYHI